MSINSVGANTRLAVQSLVDMRRQFGDLQRQLGTGQKSETYAGLGLGRGVSVGLRSQLSAISAFSDTITNVGMRIDLQQSALGRIAKLSDEIKGAALKSTTMTNEEGIFVQKGATNALGEIVGLLNTRAGERYLFSGRATDQPAVANVNAILDGVAGQDGLRQVIDERRLADLGSDGRGRLVVSTPAATTVALAEDAAGSPYGFKISGISSNTAAIIVSGPSGSPAGVTIDVAANPTPGSEVEIALTLPDGTVETVKLTATASQTPGPGEFTIGATAADTAASLQAALGSSLGALADTALTAASAMAAGNDFFASDPPLRVDGPPFETATAAVADTAGRTVKWYTGEDSSDPARASATARIDNSVTISYGARADEDALRRTLQNVAVLAAVSFSADDPNATTRSVALNSRAGAALGASSASGSIASIQAELAGAQTSIAAAKERHQQTGSMVSEMLAGIEGVTTEETAVKLLALQTRLQASLQTTSMLYQINLVNML
ncbi:MAG TPA: flagellar biosynthesis protein FlgL [Xanthobacteraceae bacterium]|nr:flagellar biosynthesis protein FlgL [Xanthobacteraceae bacterium]